MLYVVRIDPLDDVIESVGWIYVLLPKTAAHSEIEVVQKTEFGLNTCLSSLHFIFGPIRVLSTLE